MYTPIDCCVFVVCFCGPIRPLSLPAEAKCPVEQSSTHLWAALEVIVTAAAAESPPPTAPPVAKAFVAVLVGFGVVGAAIWRLPAMVGVVDVSFVGAKNGEKRALSPKKRDGSIERFGYGPVDFYMLDYIK